MGAPILNVFLRHKTNETMKQLTSTEEEIMQIIWVKERCMVTEIIEALGRPETPHSTISSVVRILEKKGFVSHKAYGRTHEYFPIISKEAYAQNGFKNWFANYFERSPQQLASFFVRGKALKPKEVEELLQQIKKLKTK